MPRAPLFRVSFTLSRKANSAGARPKATAVTMEAANAQTKTCQSKAKVKRSPFSDKVLAEIQSAPQRATRIEHTPPAPARRSDSLIKGRNNWKREAPSAPRTANSRARAIVRARRRLARLEQAMRRTKADRPINRERSASAFFGKAVPLRAMACHEVPAFTSGKSLASRAPKLAIKPVASASDTVSCRRPSNRRIVLRRSEDFG